MNRITMITATMITAGIGVYFVTVGIVGFLFGPLNPAMRLVAAIGGLGVLLPWGAAPGAVWINLVGLALIVALVASQMGRRRASASLTD